ncbi:hypothetical protein [uncultured Dialister sp.]|uniref:hypothetical protein n=1 Tax=uncultured Dialister sp. TaxID=278064 RepID=UPI0025DE1DE2|nr:hypothetical protein [uncultured Dialister sp.]
MRNLKKKLLMAAVLLAFTAGASALGNTADAASLSAKDSSGPISNVGRDYLISLIEADRAGGHVIHRAVNPESQAANDDATPETAPDETAVFPDGPNGQNPRMERKAPPDRQYRQGGRDGRPSYGPGEHHRYHGESENRDRHFRHEREEHRFERDGDHGDPSSCPRLEEAERHHHHRDYRFGPNGEQRHHGEWKGGDNSKFHDRNGNTRHDDGEETPPPPPPQDAQF